MTNDDDDDDDDDDDAYITIHTRVKNLLTARFRSPCKKFDTRSLLVFSTVFSTVLFSRNDSNTDVTRRGVARPCRVRYVMIQSAFHFPCS